MPEDMAELMSDFTAGHLLQHTTSEHIPEQFPVDPRTSQNNVPAYAHVRQRLSRSFTTCAQPSSKSPLRVGIVRRCSNRSVSTITLVPPLTLSHAFWVPGDICRGRVLQGRHRDAPRREERAVLRGWSVQSAVPRARKKDLVGGLMRGLNIIYSLVNKDNAPFLRTQMPEVVTCPMFSPNGLPLSHLARSGKFRLKAFCSCSWHGSTRHASFQCSSLCWRFAAGTCSMDWSAPH